MKNAECRINNNSPFNRKPKASGSLSATVRAALLVALAAGAAGACLLGRQAAHAAAPDERAVEDQAVAEAVKRRYGDGYVVRTDPQRHIVYVSALDAATFERVVWTLTAYAEAQRQCLFRLPLPWTMTVVLPTAADYRKSVRWSKALGMYQGATRTLESISVSDVLLHEFTHGLHHADQVMAGQRHAVWVVEGLASLFQRSTSRDLKITVQPGGDLGPFQETLRQGKAPALADLVAMGPAAFMEKAEACYPTARYLCFYLHRMDKLEAFYEAYKAGYAADRTGAAALEQVLGKPLAEVEKDWRAWVLAQEPPWTPARPPKAHLGVRMEAAEAGVRVTGFLRGSMAERAGALKIDDVILSVAGQATPAPRDLAAAVQSCRPGETVEIEILRRGERATVRQMLGHVLD